MGQAQSSALRKIAVMTSGGDAPGMNACIRAVVRFAQHHGLETLGVMRGYYGILHKEFVPLGARDVGGKLQEGGTFLKTARLPEFKEDDVQKRAIGVLRDREIDGLIVIGGDGSLSGAAALHRHGFPVVGVPASIDNDIFGTDATIGMDTALNTILEAIDRLRDTASSHGRVLIVETMGRSCGYLALMAGYTGGAEVIHIPEIQLSLEDILNAVEQAWEREKAHVIVTVAEGAEHKVDKIAHYIEQKHRGYECRVTMLGHVQRGGRPTHFDRLLASRMGAKSVEFLRRGEVGTMVGLQGTQLVAVPLQEVLGRTKRAPTHEYDIIRVLAQ
ncbi:MAG: 6-phosphofructokinase [Pseudomonadota bacterium]|nr:6-phosphofructokinase [Pseudomonadota bacterium]